MPRKTMRVSEIRALANLYLASSNPELTEFRRGVSHMYEHLALAAGDYHGFNDIVAVWAGEPGTGTYVEDETYRRSYYGEMSGPDAAKAQEAIDRYRADGQQDEVLERRARAARIAEGVSEPKVLRQDVAVGVSPGWLVEFRGQHFVISKGISDMVQVFRSGPDGNITDWDDVAGSSGYTRTRALRELASRPVDEDGRVLSPQDVMDAAEEAAGRHVCSSCGCPEGEQVPSSAGTAWHGISSVAGHTAADCPGPVMCDYAKRVGV
jgi:hypothetical protein